MPIIATQIDKNIHLPDSVFYGVDSSGNKVRYDFPEVEVWFTDGYTYQYHTPTGFYREAINILNKMVSYGEWKRDPLFNNSLPAQNHKFKQKTN